MNGRRAFSQFVSAVLAIGATPVLAVPPSAWVRFSGNKIVEVRVAGEADAGTHRKVTADDPVRMASVSKLFVALGVLRLVDQGALDLDRDVSDWLGWRLRNPAFPETPITLRLLLSHQSSITDADDYLIPLGDTMADKMKRPEVWDATHPPGTYFRYVNLNYPVIASVIEAATRERFDRVMAREVFTPLGVDACFNWTTCTPRKMARAVVLRSPTGDILRDDLRGKRPDCPVYLGDRSACDLAGYVPGGNGALFAPQGGLRISARDLARVGGVLTNPKSRFLSPKSRTLLFTPEWQFDGSNGDSEGGVFCRYGLGMHFLATPAASCKDDPVGDGVARLGHSGEAYGLRSGLWFDPVTRTGVAFFVTQVAADAAEGRSAFRAVEEEQLQDLQGQVHK